MATTNNDDPEYTLHEMHLSGNCYKIRLVASLLGIKLKLLEYNTLKGESRTADYTTRVNANGRVPVLQIGSDTFLPESDAACYYLASDPNAKRKLIPDDRLEHARMLQWMFFEQYSHEPCVAVLRFWRIFVGLENLSEVQRVQLPGKEQQAREALGVMERHLGEDGGRLWFVGKDVSLADLMLFAYTHCLGDSGLEIAEWPRVREWVDRVRGLEGFVAMED